MTWIKLLKGPAICLGLLVVFSGCGSGGDVPDLAPVTGQITLDGKPLEGANVTFVPDRGGISSAVTDAEGKFSLYYSGGHEGAVPGKHTVRISKMEGDAGTELVPPQYNEGSTLTKNVTLDGENDFQIEL